MNKNNFDFYINIGVDKLKDLARQGGFDTCVDLSMVYDKIKDSNKILELGAGYGRCVECLRAFGYTGKITAIEQSGPFTQYMKAHFQDPGIEILHGDFLETKFQEKFDSVLWMWSGIIDFTEEEQQNSLDKLYKITNNGANIIIDTPKIGFKTFAEHEDAQHLHLESEYGNLDCYIPSLADIKNMTDRSGFTTVLQEDYETSTQKARTLFVIKK